MSSTDFISIPLSPTDADEERYRAKDENFIEVSIQDPTGRVTQDGNSRVILRLSKDAMFALGSALVRASCNPETSKGCWEFRPATKEEAIERLGIYVHPKSCQLVINLDSMGTLDEALNSA